MIELNETHNPAMRSWIGSANTSTTDFPIQNLPLGVFRCEQTDTSRIGVAIGDQILDTHRAADEGLLTNLDEQTRNACRQARLNGLMALGAGASHALRLQLSRLLREGAVSQERISQCLIPMEGARLEVPVDIRNYTDFFSSIHHATNSGRQARPDNPLLPNFKSVPVAYHGRATSIRLSGTPCVRPWGQVLPKGAKEPIVVPTAKLDYECELGMFIGQGNSLGTRIGLDEAENHVFGVCLFNDWSARDIQTWESPTLGPFLGKSFMSSVSPWIVMIEALAPFRVAAADRGADAPALLPYLDSPRDRQHGAVDLVCEVSVQTRQMREADQAPHRLSRQRFADQYWTAFQMVAHHTLNGCNLETGDLLGSGTISGPTASELGCLKELTVDAANPVTLFNGERRGYLEDGDEITLRARCERAGYVSIGLGECRGRIEEAHSSP